MTIHFKGHISQGNRLRFPDRLSFQKERVQKLTFRYYVGTSGVRTFRPMPFQPLQFQPLQFQPFTLSTACHFNREPFQPPQIQPLQLSSNQLTHQ